MINISSVRSPLLLPTRDMLIMLIILDPYSRENASGKGNAKNVDNVNSYLGHWWEKSGNGLTLLTLLTFPLPEASFVSRR